MGSLLIGVGTSFRRWTTRRAPRTAMTRRTWCRLQAAAGRRRLLSVNISIRYSLQRRLL